MLSEILSTEIVAGVDIYRTHVILNILYIPYKTIPRYYDKREGEKKKREKKNVLVWDFLL